MSSSGCMSSASTDIGCAGDARVPARSTYVNLHKWAESDAEFIKWVSSRGTGVGGSEAAETGGAGEFKRSRHHHQQYQHHHHHHHQYQTAPKVVDSYSCRQMYLRSYTFSKKQSVPEKTRKCLGKVKEKVAVAATAVVSGAAKTRKGSDEGRRPCWGGTHTGGEGRRKRGKKKKRCRVGKRLTEVSCSAIRSIFHRLLSCTTTVDVVDVHQRPL